MLNPEFLWLGRPLLVVVYGLYYFKHGKDWRRIGFLPYFLLFFLISMFPILGFANLDSKYIDLVVILIPLFFSGSTLIIAKKYGLITGKVIRGIGWIHYEKEREEEPIGSVRRNPRKFIHNPMSSKKGYQIGVIMHKIILFLAISLILVILLFPLIVL